MKADLGFVFVTIASTVCAALLAVLLAAPCAAQTSRFEGPALVHGGGANIANAYGGSYVYRAAVPLDGRRLGRSVLGPRLRDEFTLFSAEEEAALWHLRDRSLHPPAPAIVARPSHRVVRTTAPSIDWPKVVLADGKTCVPAAAYSEASDWREHLVCWMKEARRVE